MTSPGRLASCVVLTFLGLAQLGSGSQALAAEKDRIEGLILQLGSKNFQERDTASKDLAVLGEDALPALRQATRSEDPEVRARASALVEKIESRLAAEARARVEELGGLVGDWNEGGALTPTSLQVDFSWSPSKVTNGDLKHLRWLGRVTWLKLHGTAISDAGLAHLGELTELNRLCLDRTRVTDQGLSRLRELKSLASLTLGGTRIDGSGLAHLKNLRQLRELSLTDSGVTDTGLAGVKELSGLERLSLWGTGVSDEGLKHVAFQERPGAG